jgi:hypothetical protein
MNTSLNSRTSLTPLIHSIRRRLRLAWAVATGQLAAPLVAAAALGLVLLGRFFPIAWTDQAALWLALAALLCIVGFATFTPIPDQVVARAADRGLHTRDAFATSLELRDQHGEMTDRVHQRAASLADGALSRAAVPLHLYRRPLVIALLLGPLAVLLAVWANPQDDRRAEERADRAAIEATADVLRADAARIAEQPGGTEAAERLERLADELSRTDDLTKAEQLLDDAARLIHAAIEVYGADDRLERIGKDRLAAEATGLELPGTELQLVAEADFLRDAGQRLGADDARPQAAEIALGGHRIAPVEPVGRHQVQDGVAEELETLVVGPGGAAVGERRLEQRRVERLVRQALAQPVERPAGTARAGDGHQGMVTLSSNSISSEALYISGTTSSHWTSMTQPSPVLRIETSAIFGDSM